MTVCVHLLLREYTAGGSRLQIGKLLPVPTESQMMLETAGEVSCDSWAHLLEKSRLEADSLHFSVL